jgi:hypothetical protein
MAGAVVLEDFLARAVTTPFAWGTWDCLLWLGDWVLEAHGVDPASGARGRYHTALGARRFVTRHGGPVAAVKAFAEGAGLNPIAEPEPGSIGVLPALGVRGRLDHIGGLYTGRRWAVLAAPQGLIVHPAIPVACWRV